jgi:hypothetical protein
MILNKIFLIYSEWSLKTKFKNEHINNDLPNNQVTMEGNDNLLIPTSDQVFNPYDSNRPANQYSHQETNLNNSNNSNTELVDTDMSIPIIYTHDEIGVTNTVTYNPSMTMIDSGSGTINSTNEINNNVMNNFSSIE